MKEIDFINYLDESIKSLSLEKQKLILEEMKNKWISKYIEEKFKMYSLCNGCGKYSLTEDNKKIFEIEDHTEAIHIDAGYGDDDTYGKVRYLVEYSICPNCLKKTEKSKELIRILSEKKRY